MYMYIFCQYIKPPLVININFISCACIIFVMSRYAQTTEEAKAIYTLPDHGAGERIPLNILYHSPEKVGNLLQTASF